MRTTPANGQRTGIIARDKPPLLRRVNLGGIYDGFSLLCREGGIFCRAAPTIGDIGDDILTLMKHPFVAAVDGKSFWHRFHSLGEDAVVPIHVSGRCRHIGKRDGHAYIRMLLLEILQCRINKAIKISVITDIKVGHVVVFDQIGQNGIQNRSDALWGIAVPEKGAGWHNDLFSHTNLVYLK